MAWREVPLPEVPRLIFGLPRAEVNEMFPSENFADSHFALLDVKLLL